MLKTTNLSPLLRYIEHYLKDCEYYVVILNVANFETLKK